MGNINTLSRAEQACINSNGSVVNMEFRCMLVVDSLAMFRCGKEINLMITPQCIALMRRAKAGNAFTRVMDVGLGKIPKTSLAAQGKVGFKCMFLQSRHAFVVNVLISTLKLVYTDLTIFI
jgi:hypothetical protein